MGFDHRCKIGTPICAGRIYQLTNGRSAAVEAVEEHHIIAWVADLVQSVTLDPDAFDREWRIGEGGYLWPSAKQPVPDKWVIAVSYGVEGLRNIRAENVSRESNGWGSIKCFMVRGYPDVGPSRAPVHKVEPGEEKPPLGLMPRAIFERQRCRDIIAAMNRYLEEGKPVPPDWLEELNEILPVGGGE